MADLKKWFPFKFRRNRGETQSAETAPGPTPTPSEALPALPWAAGPLHTDLNRLMRSMFGDNLFLPPQTMLREVDRFFGDFSPARFDPTVDIVDEGSHVRVSAELPGISRDDLSLEVHEGILTLAGEKKHESSQEEDGCYRTERYFGSFRRTVPLPRDLDYGAAEAQFDHGVLTVRLPKIEPAPAPKKIEVR